METFKVEVIRPGVTTGVSAVEREYIEDELRDAVDSLQGARVTDDSRVTDVDGVIGEVTDAWYDEGIECTVEIFDEEMAGRIDEGLVQIAPSMVLDSDESGEPIVAQDIEFRYLFLCPQASELVGSTERVA